jgi:HPt (histidine-containing phosphotransfer) domain-containing protein
MASSKQEKPSVTTFGDHEIITPDTSKLRETVLPAASDEPDPLARAEKALAEMAGEFSAWMSDECDRLDNARRRVREMGLSKDTRHELFLAAHDIKGGAGTFGYPEVIPAADSLCRLLEHAPDLSRIPTAIIDHHVDAIRAIVREHASADIAVNAAALTGKLREVTDEFLIRENHDRPEVLKAIRSPSLAPGESF